MLKKAGIVNVQNVRTAQPWMPRKAGPRGGTYTLAELVDKYDDVISGKATPVKLPPEKLKQYKKQGYEAVGKDKILVDHVAGGKVRVTRSGDIQRVEPPGIKSTAVPVKYENLYQYLTDLQKSGIKKDSGKQWAFRYRGGHSKTYSSLPLMIEALLEYDEIDEAINEWDIHDQNDIYRHLEIIETTKSAWKGSKQRAKAHRKKHSHNKPHARARRLDRAIATGKAEEYRAKRAKEAREYRAKMTPAEREAYNARARVRNKRNRKK